MDKFITPKDDNRIEISVSYESKAARYRRVAFYLMEKDNPESAEILTTTDLLYTSFDKSAAENKPVLQMRIQFIVDRDQLANKTQIMHETTVKTSFTDNNGSEISYDSDFSKTPGEYRDRTKHLFLITKQVEIVFT